MSFDEIVEVRSKHSDFDQLQKHISKNKLREEEIIGEGAGATGGQQAEVKSIKNVIQKEKGNENLIIGGKDQLNEQLEFSPHFRKKGSELRYICEQVKEDPS